MTKGAYFDNGSKPYCFVLHIIIEYIKRKIALETR
jgi:hypothetical protein